MKKYALLAIGLLLSGLAAAGAYQFENAKLHCVFLKNGKVVKQQNCIADGSVRSNVYSGGEFYTFRPIKSYGKIRVDTGISFSDTKMDKDGSPMIEEQWENLNGKPAVVRRRVPKTFKLATQKQVERDDGKLYTCYIHKKNPKYEFCFR